MKIVKTLLIFGSLIISGFGQQVGTPAPQFSHRTLDHGQISLSDYAGKVVYLFFFGWS